MDKNEFEKNEEFCKWMADLGKINEVCSNGKTYVVNPKALNCFMSITNFFKKKSDEHMKECKKCGIKGNPYEISTLPTKPWLGDITLVIQTNDEDDITFSFEEIKLLQNMMNENVTMILGGTINPERFQIWFIIENYFVEMKSK